MRKKMMRVLAIAAITALSVVPARADNVCQSIPVAGDACAGGLVLSGPAAKSVGFLTPVVVVQQGGPLTYINADIEGHNVESCHFEGGAKVCDYGPDTNPWCGEPDYPAGKCPLFWSPVRGASIQQVLGLENAVPGKTYGFYCRPHGSAMTGTLVVLPKAS